MSTRLACEHVAGDRGVLSGIADRHLVDRANGQTQIGRGDVIALDGVTADLDHGRVTGGRDLVETVEAVHDKGPIDAPGGQHLGDDVHARAVRHAEQLPPDTTRVRQRTENVEHRRDAEFASHPGDEAHCGVKDPGERESDVRLGDATLDPRAVEFDRDAELFENIDASGG